MGFIFSQYTKGMYIDGHERDDVVAYRKEFLETMKRQIFYFLIIFNILFIYINIFLYYSYQKLMPKFISNKLEIRIDSE